MKLRRLILDDHGRASLGEQTEEPAEFYACVRVADSNDTSVPSVIDRCGLCRRRVWIDKMMESYASTLKIVCIPCVIAEVKRRRGEE